MPVTERELSSRTWRVVVAQIGWFLLFVTTMLLVFVPTATALLWTYGGWDMVRSSWTTPGTDQPLMHSLLILVSLALGAGIAGIVAVRLWQYVVRATGFLTQGEAKRCLGMDLPP